MKTTTNRITGSTRRGESQMASERQTASERQNIRRVRAPRHPGALLREIVLPASGLNQTTLAERIGVSRRTVNMILNEQRPVTPDIAHRLGRVFGNGPNLWLKMQQAVDLWNAERKNEDIYREIEPVEMRDLAA